MNGPMKKVDYGRYLKTLQTMPEPIMASELPRVKLDLRGAHNYAKKRGITVAELSEHEKKQFIQGVK